MGKLSRNKGARWERAVARALTDATERAYLRNLSETRDGNSGDVLTQADDLTPIAALHRTGRGGEKVVVLAFDDFLELASALPAYSFLVQCKCGVRPNAFGALREAQEAVDAG